MGTLLHEGADSEPEAVHDCELIFDEARVRSAWMRIAPLVRREPRQKEKHKADHFKKNTKHFAKIYNNLSAQRFT